MNDMKLREKTSSAEVNINAKGAASFSVKTYFDVDEKEANEVADKLESIMNELRTRFN